MYFKLILSSRVIYCLAVFTGVITAYVAAMSVIEAPLFNEDYADNFYDEKSSNYKGEPYNPDIELTTPEMITRAGYPAEAHVVKTDDGYLLTLHRIPNKSGHPVLMQHGLLGSSADWVIPGRGKGLAYLLADEGFDVWLGNCRGNTYSQAHVDLSTKDAKFWDFTFHEMGIHDLPAVINHISNYTGNRLIYIGHSMGTTMSFIMASQRPDVSKKVRLMISLAPVAFMSHLKSPVRILAPYVSDLELIEKFFGLNEFLPQNFIVKLLAKYGCMINTAEAKVCENIMFALCGYDEAQFNRTLVPVITNHDPAGASTKTILHYMQEMVSGRFRQYDYGTKRNMELYNATSPPDYDLSKIQVPVFFFYSDNDWMAAVQDVKQLYKLIPNPAGMERVNFSQFNHLDFLWGIDAPKLIYRQLIDLVHSFRQKYHVYD